VFLTISYYVMRNPVESGGRVWPVLFGLICVSLFICQVLAIGNLVVPLFTLSSVSNRGPLVFAAFTPFATIVFYFAMRHWFKVSVQDLNFRKNVVMSKKIIALLSQEGHHTALVILTSISRRKHSILLYDITF
jgi:hypothetical protein